MFSPLAGMRRPGQGMPDENNVDMGQYGDMPSFLDGGQPAPPNNRQMFLGGIKNSQGSQGSMLARGLSGFSGSGGLRGGIGRLASFMI